MGARIRRALHLPGGPDREVEEEFAFHLAARIEELEARGVAPEEARAEALRGFGDLERVRRRCRSLAARRDRSRRRGEWLDTLRRDVRFGLRQLRSHAGLTTAVVLTLGLGIGGVTALFSVVDATLLRPLPFEGGDRLLRIYETWRGYERGRASPGHYLTFRTQATSLEAVAAYDEASFNLGGDDPERLLGGLVTPSYFQVLAAPPAAGRYFTPEEGAPGGADVAVLSWSTWQRRFGGDPGVVGATIHLSDRPYTVVGVAPRALAQVGSEDQVYVPAVFGPEDAENFDSHGLLLVARRRPGASVTEVQRELARLTAGIAERAPRAMTDRGIFAASFQDELVRGSRTVILALFAAVTFVLLMAAVNVASLLLARGTGRRTEVAVRLALGGTRQRLVAQFLTESVLLALLGGALGAVVAWAGVGALRGLADGQAVPRLAAAVLDARALLFALAVTAACGLGFGALPALRVTRDVRGALRDEDRGGTGRRDRVRAALVVMQLACALTLLLSAGLLLRSAAGLAAVPLGFRPDGVLTARVSLPAAAFPEGEGTEAAFTTMLARMEAAPGVASAALLSHLPLTGVGFDSGIEVEGGTYDASTVLSPHQRAASPGFVRTLGMRMVSGRALEPGDLAPDAAPVVLVNEELARRMAALFPEVGPVVGRRIAAWEGESGVVLWRTVVGVVGDARVMGPEEPAVPELFFPYTRVPGWYWDAVQRTVGLAARGQGDPLALAPALRAAAAEVHPGLPLFGLQSMEDLVRRAAATRRLTVTLFALFGAVALGLAVVGVYGLLAFNVARRTREMGVRQALGATRGGVARLLVLEGARLTLAGLAVGAAGAWAAGRLLRGLLFGVAAGDALTWAAAVLLLAAAALGATLLPALRAARVPPARALRG